MEGSERGERGVVVSNAAFHEPLLMPILRDCPLSLLEGPVVVNALFFGGDWEYWIFGGPVLGVWIEAERDVRPGTGIF